MTPSAGRRRIVPSPDSRAPMATKRGPANALLSGQKTGRAKIATPSSAHLIPQRHGFPANPVRRPEQKIGRSRVKFVRIRTISPPLDREVDTIRVRGLCRVGWGRQCAPHPTCSAHAARVDLPARGRWDVSFLHNFKERFESRAHRPRSEGRRLGDNKDLWQRNGKIRGDFDDAVGRWHCYSLRDRGGFVPKGAKSRRALKKHDMAASHTPKSSEKPSIRPISGTDSGGIKRPRGRTRCSIRSPKKKRIEYDTKTRNAARPMA